MTEVTTGARSEALTPDEKASLRQAMLSVYYRSLGSQLETRGAPVVAVPPEVRPLTLEDALGVVERWPARLWDAYWRIVRAVPLEGWREPLERRYPRALVERLGHQEVEALDEHRRKSRAGAHLFAAALQACAEQRWDEANALAALLERQAGGGSDEARQFAETSESVLGMTAERFLGWLLESQERKDRLVEELEKLEGEVGLNLHDFVEDFADAVAFADFKKQRGAPETTLTSSCIVRQDTSTLTTTAIVTALVPTKFDALAEVIDPVSWPKYSDVIDETDYLSDPFDLESGIEVGPPGKGFEDPRYLFERVGVNWGDEDGQSGEFRNVLAIDEFSVRPELQSITLPFRLCRSIDSTILWDKRAGGILVDEGKIAARPVGPDRWRLTTTKVLRFSDRTPYSNPPGWRDLGQMLNYLAPAAVTWWLETELYSYEYLVGAKGGRQAARAVQQSEGRS